MSGCQRCNSGCQSQNTCSWCNDCEACNVNCDGVVGCNACLSFCESAQSVGGFSFNQSLQGGDLFLTKTNWNRLITYINNAYKKGNVSLTDNAQSGKGVIGTGAGGDSGLPESDSNDFMTASMFNKVSEALGGLGSTGPTRRVKANIDIVYGSYFQDLEDYANILLYKDTQCYNCNASCNIKCNTCLVCNVENCGKCDGSCQAHSPSSCCSSSCQKSCQNKTPSGGGSSSGGGS